jgi:hypothetical protein
MSTSVWASGDRSCAPRGLADVIDSILDKGLVIDAYVRVSLVGIEVLTIDARIVVASVDTYLRFAEAVGRLHLEENKQGLPELLETMQERGAGAKTRGAVRGAVDVAEEKLGHTVAARRDRDRGRPRRGDDDG